MNVMGVEKGLKNLILIPITMHKYPSSPLRDQNLISFTQTTLTPICFGKAKTKRPYFTPSTLMLNTLPSPLFSLTQGAIPLDVFLQVTLFSLPFTFQALSLSPLDMKKS